MPRAEGLMNTLNQLSEASSLTVLYLPTCLVVALKHSFPVGLSNVHTKKYSKKIKRQQIRSCSKFLFHSNIRRAVYGLSSLVSIPFLLRPCTFKNSLLLRDLLCTTYSWDASEFCVTKAFIHLGYYLKRNLLRVFLGIHTA